MRAAKTNKTFKVLGSIAVLFGLATVLSGGRTLFGGDEARASMGEAVPFVLWFNFFAGFLYVMAGAGLILRKTWGTRVSVFLLASTAAVFAAFGLHVAGDGAYEARTMVAMTLRTLFWALAAAAAVRRIGCAGNRCAPHARGHRAAFVPIAAMAMALQACGKAEHGHQDGSHADRHVPAGEDHGSRGKIAPEPGKPAPEIRLDDHGRKWQADSSTLAGIRRMQERAESFAPGARVGDLRLALQQDFDQLLGQCTMQGKAHDQLHHFLVPLRDRIDALEEGNRDATVPDLKRYLAAFWDSFGG